MQKLITTLINSIRPRSSSGDSRPGDIVQMPSVNDGSACYAPSVNMLFATDGSVRACCHNSENTLGRYPDQTIREIWDSEAARTFRQSMADHKFLSGCSGCAADYHAGHTDQMPARHFELLPRRTDYPVMMEFLLSNTCNLECIMCSGELSSSIRRNRDKLPPIHSPYGPDFIAQLQEFLPYLRETRFSGAGEAFSIDIYYDLWKTLTERNPDCLLVVQTNGTVLNTRIKDILEAGNFQIGVSLDSLRRETFESIRLNASFDNVMRNIAYFSEYSTRKKRTFTISTCVMRQNWQEMPAFVEYCNNIGAHLIFHKVWSPLSCALYNLTADELSHIHKALSGAIFSTGTALERKNARTYRYFLSVIGRWQIEAAAREAAGMQWQEMTNAELHDRVNEHMATYIRQQAMLEADREHLIGLCRDKFAAVMELWLDEADKRRILLKLVSIPVSEMIVSLKTHPVSKLYEMSQTTPD